METVGVWSPQLFPDPVPVPDSDQDAHEPERHHPDDDTSRDDTPVILPVSGTYRDVPPPSDLHLHLRHPPGHQTSSHVCPEPGHVVSAPRGSCPTQHLWISCSVH